MSGFSISDYNEAEIYYSKLLHYALDMKDSVRMAMAWHGLGNISLGRGGYDSAAYFYFRALKVFEEHDLTGELSKVLNNLGLIYYYQEDYDKAMPYFSGIWPYRKC